MKSILLTLMLIGGVVISKAQDKRPKTLIGNDPEEISGFGSALFSFTTIDGSLSPMTGGGGAVLFDNSFYIGGYGLGLTGNIEHNIGGEVHSSSYGHGGFWLGYNIQPDELVHFGIDTKLGWGSITTKSNSIIEDRITDDVFVFSPSGFIEANISSWFKVNGSLGLQKTIGVDKTYFKSSDFDGPTFGITLLFGWFN